MSKNGAGEEVYGLHRKSDMKKTTTQAEMIQKSQNAKGDFCL